MTEAHSISISEPNAESEIHHHAEDPFHVHHLDHPILSMFLERIETLKEKFENLVLENEKIGLENQTLSAQLESQEEKHNILKRDTQAAIDSKNSTSSLLDQAEVAIANLNQHILLLESQSLDQRNSILNITAERDCIYSSKQQLETSLLEEMLHSSRMKRDLAVLYSQLQETQKESEKSNKQSDKKDIAHLPEKSSQKEVPLSGSSAETLCETTSQGILHPMPTVPGHLPAPESNSKMPVELQLAAREHIVSEASASHAVVSTAPPHLKSPTNRTMPFLTGAHTTKSFSTQPSAVNNAALQTSKPPNKTAYITNNACGTPAHTVISSSISTTSSLPKSETNLVESELRHARAEIQRLQDQLQVLHGQLGAALSNNEILESQLRILQAFPHANAKDFEKSRMAVSAKSGSAANSLKQLQLDLNNEVVKYQTCLKENEKLNQKVSELKEQGEELHSKLEKLIKHNESVLKSHDAEKQKWIMTIQSNTVMQSNLHQAKDELLSKLDRLEEVQDNERKVHQQVLEEANATIGTLNFKKERLKQDLADAQQQITQLKVQLDAKVDKIDATDALQTLQSEFLLLEKSYLAQIEHLHREVYLFKQKARERETEMEPVIEGAQEKEKNYPRRTENAGIPSKNSITNSNHRDSLKIEVEQLHDLMKTKDSTFLHTTTAYKKHQRDFIQLKNQSERSSTALTELPPLIPDPNAYQLAKALILLKNRFIQCQQERDHFECQANIHFERLKKERQVFARLEQVQWLQKARGYKAKLKKLSEFRASLILQKQYLVYLVQGYQQNEVSTWRILQELDLPYQIETQGRSPISKFRSCAIAVLSIYYLKKNIKLSHKSVYSNFDYKSQS